MNTATKPSLNLNISGEFSRYVCKQTDGPTPADVLRAFEAKIKSLLALSHPILEHATIFTQKHPPLSSPLRGQFTLAYEYTPAAKLLIDEGLRSQIHLALVFLSTSPISDVNFMDAPLLGMPDFYLSGAVDFEPTDARSMPNAHSLGSIDIDLTVRYTRHEIR